MHFKACGISVTRTVDLRSFLLAKQSCEVQLVHLFTGRRLWTGSKI